MRANRWQIASVVLAIGCASATPSGRPGTSALRIADPAIQAAERRRLIELRLLAAIDTARQRWMEQEDQAHSGRSDGIGTPLTVHRAEMLHCHVDGLYSSRIKGIQQAPSSAREPKAMPMLVRSLVRRVGVCPNWAPIRDSVAERNGHRRPTDVPRAPFPESVVAALDSAAVVMPDDLWLLRQRVRVFIDNEQPDRIRPALFNCREQWCNLIAGYAHYLKGDFTAAHATWERVWRALSPAQLCQLFATQELAPGGAEGDVETPCDERWVLDSDIWWLAKPLFSDSLNYRFLEQVARLIRSDLVADLPRDIHGDLRPEVGGDAVRRMRLRYGWPTHVFWGGKGHDAEHESYLRERVGWPRYPGPPYTSPEYSRDAVSTMPTVASARTPYTIRDEDFFVDPQPNRSGDVAWPHEFFMHPNGIIMGIRAQQRALLRRDHGAVLVIAATLPAPPSATSPESRVPLRLYSSVASDSLQLLNETFTSWGSRAFVSGLVRRPTVIGLEVPRGGARIAGARSRFGIARVPTHANTTVSCGLSEPILLDASALSGSATRDLAEGMLSDTRLHRPTKLGLLWESYGVRVGDSVTISVRVTGLTDRDGLGRVAQSLRILDREGVAIAVSWREPAPERHVEVIEGSVVTLSRQLTLDVSSLRGGSYGVQIMLETRSCSAVSPIRPFSVTR
jgi:hypothetical protein